GAGDTRLRDQGAADVITCGFERGFLLVEHRLRQTQLSQPCFFHFHLRTTPVEHPIQTKLETLHGNIAASVINWRRVSSRPDLAPASWRKNCKSWSRTRIVASSLGLAPET